MPRVLLGIHDQNWVRTITSIAKLRGWELDSAANLEEMIGMVTGNYDLYLMDANFGDRNSNDITPARTIYEIVQPRVRAGETHFMAIAGVSSTAVEDCKKEGIPAMYKPEFNLSTYLRSIQ
jgi:hypothetical protein